MGKGIFPSQTANDMIEEPAKNEAAPQFNDFFDLQEIQQIQDAFAKATGVASIITDSVGQPITKPSNFCRLCNIIRSTQMGSEHCVNSDDMIGSFNPTGPNIRRCLSSGLWDVSANLVVDGKHVANWLVGQVVTEEGQEESILQYAQKIGANSAEIQVALTEVTHMSSQRLNEIGQFLFLIAYQLSKMATENIQKENEIRLRVRAERLQAALYQISETVSSSRSLEELYRAVHVIIGTLIPAKNFYIAIKDEEQGLLHFPYRVDECDGNAGSRKLTNGLAEYAIEVGQPMLIDPQMRAEMEEKGIVQTIGARAMDWLGVPLKTADHKVFGVMAVFTFVERVRYTKEHQDVLSFVSNQVAMAIERKKAEEALRFLGRYDVLTGLYNRAYFEKRIRLLDKECFVPLTVLMCDIDGLKLVNDTFGHASGDQLLIATAKLITQAIRQDDLAARIGGDEFAIILPHADERVADALTKRIRLLLLKYNQKSQRIPLSLSVGYAGKKNNELIQELMKKADNAMYREKLHHSQSGRSAIVQTVMKLLEERDFITEEHGERLQDLMVKFAGKLNLPESRIAELRLFAKFHDIGKVGIPDHILLKPGPLNVEERKEMQRHCEIGYRIAHASADLVPISDWILKHQEWWNGKGYPLRLAGEKIPLECRILAIADAYDAMTNDRPYRKALSHEYAIEELQRYASKQFDPELVKIFISIVQ